MQYPPYWSLTARLADGRIETEAPIDELRAHMAADGVVVLTGLWSTDEALALRRAARDWADARASHPTGRSASVAGLSFHRFDAPGAGSHIDHMFHQIGWCEDTHGDDALWRQACAMMQPLLDFENRLAGTATSLADPMNRIKLMNHPGGGGFLLKHSHPLERLGVAYFLSLSRPGVDYAEGDVFFEIDGHNVPAGMHFAAGNALFFRYDLPHGVSPIDPDKQCDWSEEGLWIASVEPIGAYLDTRTVA